MLKTIERATRQKITIEKIPTVADLRARRLELTRAGLEESLLEDSLDAFRVVVESLAEQYDVMDVAAAAVKLAHELSGATPDEEEIPDIAPQPASERKERSRPSGPLTRVFVGVGRVAGIRAQDLVGAIVNEAGVAAREIGGIEISDRFSLVEVPDDQVDHVIRALRASTIKGRRANVRRERFTAPRPRR